jgi:hypothetical protein
LDDILRAAQNMARNGAFDGDPAEIERLAQQIIDPFRSVELELSRELQLLMAKENVRSARDDEIPSGYRPLVEEYYRRLSDQRQ